MARSQEPYRDHSSDATEPEWLHKHIHEPNLQPPSTDPSFILTVVGQPDRMIAVDDLAQMPRSVISDCFIVSTGHGTSGPFDFGGVRLADFVDSYLPAGLKWAWADIVSADGFGNRVFARELATDNLDRPILLATHLNGKPMTRTQGLIRLIVPDETDDALRQVKWIDRVEFR